MRKTKTRMELFSLHDHVGLTKHLEKQAQKGWLLEYIGRLGWRYRRIEPTQLKFAVTYFPPASMYDPEPSEQERTFQDYCEQAGWKLAASSAQLQIFYHESPDPIPLETDALLQVENIHAAAKKTTLFAHWLLGIMGLFYSLTWFISFFENPVGMLADYGAWFRAISFLNLVLLCAVELTSYYRWHKKAVVAAEETGQLHPTRSHRLFQVVSLTITFTSLFLWFLFMQSRRTKVLAAVCFGNMALLMGAVQGCQFLLKKLKVSKTWNKVITLSVDFLLAFLLMGMLPQLVLDMDLSDKTPVDTYTYLGRVREVYQDPLPVSVEDLIEADPLLYNKELEVQKTVLAAIYDANQSHRRDQEADLPDMDYRLAVCAVPAWTEFCWNGWMEMPRYQHLEEQDPAPWKALEAQRIIDIDGNAGGWLIRWEDRFIRLNADWELTAQQMGHIADAILNCAE